MRSILAPIGLIALVAGCSPTVPDSAAGVGFGDYDSYQREQVRRERLLNGEALPAPDAVSSETLSPANTLSPAPVQTASVPSAATTAPTGTTTTASSDAERLAAQTAAALNSGEEPLQASPSNPAPQVAVNATGISNENDFSDVSSLRSIEGDKARIAQNRAQYQVVEPTDLPSRDGSTGPNIVSYALQTSHPVGVKIYSRFRTGEARTRRNCGRFASPDLAQAEFLSRGGPQRDRLGIDPDGDGYACSWDPAPFRKVDG